MTSAFKRHYDAEGKEIAVMQGKSQKLRTGFLQTSYKDITVEESGKLTLQQARDTIGSTPVASISRKPDGSVFEFWGEEDTMDKVEFFMNEAVRAGFVFVLFFRVFGGSLKGSSSSLFM